MAKVAELNQEDWQEWLKSRPPVIVEMAAKYPPDRLYKMKSTGHRVTLVSYFENGTVRVEITGQYNLIDFDRQVFGVDPNDLEECDLPVEGEKLGTIITDEKELEGYIAFLRDVLPLCGNDGCDLKSE